ncbi:short chain dehydrogenase/reductase family oxidoreductase [Streptomyces sp. GBA 94-10 4N24]|nr:short chain dehydrogenase/reductase family oxidoreductase [Streptomyces sp. GBA 94-10 4N24]UZN58077.1 short chain dehydrogenase/reductase family oxidoreductase [Streptomyces sp. GBA 94-10 4N24]
MVQHLGARLRLQGPQHRLARAPFGPALRGPVPHRGQQEGPGDHPQALRGAAPALHQPGAQAAAPAGAGRDLRRRPRSGRCRLPDRPGTRAQPRTGRGVAACPRAAGAPPGGCGARRGSWSRGAGPHEGPTLWSRRPVPDEEHSLSAEGLSTAGGGIPAGRVGRPEGVARAIRFLTSDDAWYITGQQLVVDGGLTVRFPDRRMRHGRRPSGSAGLLRGGRAGLPVRRPRGQQAPALVGGGARLGGAEGEGQAGLGGHLQALVGEGERADGRVVETLGAGSGPACRSRRRPGSRPGPRRRPPLRRRGPPGRPGLPQRRTPHLPRHGAGPGRDRGPRPSRRRPRRPDRAPVRLPRRARRVPALRRTAARMRPRRSLDRALAVAALLPGAPSPTPRNPP